MHLECQIHTHTYKTYDESYYFVVLLSFLVCQLRGQKTHRTKALELMLSSNVVPVRSHCPALMFSRHKVSACVCDSEVTQARW